MSVPLDILRNDEQLVYKLRSLYAKNGYTGFKLSRFEQYELYAANRAFLPHGDIIAFTDAGGRLMALRPDVTLSVIKSINDTGSLQKLYYNENVYRTADGVLKEQMQAGLECIGPVNAAQTAEVIMLAAQSLSMLGGNIRLDISHMGFLGGLLGSEKLTAGQRTDIMRCLSKKNIPALRDVCENAGAGRDFCGRLESLIAINTTITDAKKALQPLNINNETGDALGELTQLGDALSGNDICNNIYIDFSIINDVTYYSGIIIQGFIDGIPEKVLSGGRYDRLLHDFGKAGGAVGFAINIDAAAQAGIQAPESVTSGLTEKMLGIALPKGRLGESALELFVNAGIISPGINREGRRLVIEDKGNGIRFFWVKPADVAVYVQRGAADIGIAGKDTVLETNPDVFELMDLNIGKCRMCIAAQTGFAAGSNYRLLRAATKFPNIAREHFAKQGIDADIIKLNGSIELAPLLGLSDVIVDIVETGKTLADNGMEPIETIADINAQLISNKASYKFNSKKINKICADLWGPPKTLNE